MPFLIFFAFLDVSTIFNDQPVCHIFHWAAHPTSGALCNHCNRLMHGQTIDDVIFKRPTPSLTEDEIMEIIRCSDPGGGAWDDFTLRVTLRINRYLLLNPDMPDPDLDVLNSI